MSDDRRKDPLVTAEVDLRDFAFMPLDVVRLRDSGLTAKASGDEFRAAVLLWCASWHQQPAASLPNDDEELANLCGYSRAMREWMKIRKGALRGWIECSDGRLYHPTVAAKAREAWQSKLAQRARTEAARKAREEQRQRQSQALSQASEKSVTDTATESKGQGQGQGQGIEEIHPSGVGADKPRRPTKKAPADFELTDDLRTWAAEHAPSVDPVAELAKLKDHTFATARVDWHGTLRNWLRKAQDDAAKRPAQWPSAGHDEPEWRRIQRERNEAFLGPAAARRQGSTTATAEVIDVTPRLVG